MFIFCILVCPLSSDEKKSVFTYRRINTWKNIANAQRGYRSAIDAKIADERSRYDLARRSSRLMATRQPRTFVGSPRKDGSRKLANDLARAGSSHLTMANEAIHRNIRGLESDRAYLLTYFVSKIRIPNIRVYRCKRSRDDDSTASLFRIGCRDFVHPQMENLDRRPYRSCEDDGRNLATDCASSSLFLPFTGYDRFDVRYFAIKNYWERYIIILSIGSRFRNEYDIFGYS